MKELAELLAASLSIGSVLTLPLALIGGLVTGLNPCCLALYPAAAATCCAVRGDGMRTALGASLAFIAGGSPRRSPDERWQASAAGRATR